jgi:hypothetical protein
MRNILKYTVVVAVLTAAYSAYPNVKWHVEVVTGDASYKNSMVLDSSDNAHIGYWKCIEWPEYTLLMASYDGSDWLITEVTTVNEPVCVSLACDSQDRLHLAYSGIWGKTENNNPENPVDYYLRYALYDGVGWVFDGIDMGTQPSISVDSSNYPRIAYLQCWGGIIPDFWPWYAYYDGVDWHIEGVYWWGNGYPSLDVDQNDCSHIAANDIHGLKYSYYDGIDWEFEIVDGETENEFPALALDSSGNPHISYETDEPVHALKYAYFNGIDWEKEIVDEVGNPYILSDITIDYKDRPHVAYIDRDNGRLKYAYNDGSSWYIETISENVALYSNCSIAVDSDDYPRISFRSNAGLAYAWYGSAVDVELTDFSACPTPDFDILIGWVIEATEGESVAGFNLYRRPVTESVKNNVDDYKWTTVNSTLITGESPYTYLDDGVEPGVTYEYRLEAIVEGSAETLGTTTGTAGAQPVAFALYQSRPNPARGETVISFELPEDTDVTLSVYDLSGRRVATLADGLLPAGEHERAVSGLAPGVYIYRLDAGDFVATQKMVIIE